LFPSGAEIFKLLTVLQATVLFGVANQLTGCLLRACSDKTGLRFTYKK